MRPRLLRLHPSRYKRLVRLGKEAERDGAYRVAKRLQAVLGFPAVVGLLADAVLAADLGRLHAGLSLLQDGDDLFFAVSFASHSCSSLPTPPPAAKPPGSSHLPWTSFRGQGHVYQLHRADLNKGAIPAFRRERCSGSRIIVNPRSLEADSVYEFEFPDTSTKQLIRTYDRYGGLEITVATRPGSSLVFYRRMK